MTASQQESKLLDTILSQFDPDHLGILGSDGARALLAYLELDPETLGDIWAMVDGEDRGFLDMDQLLTFIRLVGYAQCGHDYNRPECRRKPGPVAILEGWDDPVDKDGPSATEEERILIAELFKEGDPSGFGILDMDAARNILLRSGLSTNALGRIWDIVDEGKKGFLTPSDMKKSLRLISWAQKGIFPNRALLKRSAPLPSLDDTWVASAPTPAEPEPTARNSFSPNPAIFADAQGADPQLPPLTSQARQTFAELFNRAPLINGTINGDNGRQIFERSRLPEETLGQIWELADRDNSGFLTETEFILAMYLIKGVMDGTIERLPRNLPQWLINRASGRSARQSAGSSSEAPPPAPPPKAQPSAPTTLVPSLIDMDNEAIPSTSRPNGSLNASARSGSGRTTGARSATPPPPYVEVDHRH